MEVLADVSADAFFKNEFAAWMMLNKRADVQNELVKHDVLLTFCNSCFKFSCVHTFLHFGKRIFLSKYSPAQNLQNDKDCEESDKIDRSQGPTNWHVHVVVIVAQNSGCDCNLGEEYKTESKKTVHCFDEQEPC